MSTVIHLATALMSLLKVLVIMVKFTFYGCVTAWWEEDRNVYFPSTYQHQPHPLSMSSYDPMTSHCHLHNHTLARSHTRTYTQTLAHTDTSTNPSKSNATDLTPCHKGPHTHMHAHPPTHNLSGRVTM